jgi:predicted PurR-regulated permease PerM
VLLALFLAAVLESLAARLRARGWRPALAAVVVFAGALAVLAAAIAWISTSVAGQMGDVGASAEQGLEDVQEWLSDELDLSAEQLDRVRDQLVSSARTAGEGGVARSVIGGARLAVQVAGGLVLMLFTLFFLIKDGQRMADWILDRAPPRYREDLVAMGRGGRTVLRRYFLAVGLTGLVDAVLIAIALWAIGVPLVGPLALLTFFSAFIPIIGALTAGLVATLVALVTNGFGDALLVLAATVVVQQVEGNVLQPFIFGPVVRLHELVTVLAVAAGLAVGGVVGAFLAVPIVALAVNIGHFYRGREVAVGPQPPG